METLKLLNKLTDLVMAQKTVLGVTCGFHQEEFLDLTNKIRASLPALSSEIIMEKTEAVLARHLRSQEDVAAIINEPRLEPNI